MGFMFVKFRCSKCFKLISTPSWKFQKALEEFSESKILCGKCSKKYFGEVYDVMSSQFPNPTSPLPSVYSSLESESNDPSWEELLKYQSVRKKKDKHFQTKMKLEGGE